MAPELSDHVSRPYDSKDFYRITGIKQGEIERYAEQARVPIIKEKETPYYLLGSLDGILDRALAGVNKKGRVTKKNGEYNINRRNIDEWLKAAKIIIPKQVTLEVQKRSDKGMGYTGKRTYLIKAGERTSIKYAEDYYVDTEREIEEMKVDLVEMLKFEGLSDTEAHLVIK